jgi:hypothetical protein
MKNQELIDYLETNFDKEQKINTPKIPYYTKEYKVENNESIKITIVDFNHKEPYKSFMISINYIKDKNNGGYIMRSKRYSLTEKILKGLTIDSFKERINNIIAELLNKNTIKI